MDAETKDEFRRIRERMKQYEEDSRQLIRVTVVVKALAKKVDRFSLAVSTLAVTVLADLVSHYIK